MPIYAYKCESCGHRKDVLQKMSDPLLTQCPACGAATFVKQVTAAGFQLKGSGWYVTDFRDGGAKKDKPAADGEGGASANVTSMQAPIACTCTMTRNRESHHPGSSALTPCSQCTTKRPAASIGKPELQPWSAAGTKPRLRR